jgi:hypothetical protein
MTLVRRVASLEVRAFGPTKIRRAIILNRPDICHIVRGFDPHFGGTYTFVLV